MAQGDTPERLGQKPGLSGSVGFEPRLSGIGGEGLGRDEIGLSLV